MKVLKTLSLAALVAFVALPAAAQTGDDALRFAQRSPLATPLLAGSAGVGVAGRGDLGDLFRNPAGLGLMKRGSLSLSLNTSSVQDDALYSVGGGSTEATSTDLSSTRLGSVAYAYKLPTSQGSFVMAAGMSQVASFQRSLEFSGENGLNSLTDYLMPLPDEFDLVEEDGNLFPDFYRPLSFIGYETFAIDLDGDAAAAGAANPFLPAVSAGTVSQSGLVNEEGYMNEFAFATAWEASKDVFVGVSLNVPYGRYQFLRVLDEDDAFNDNDGTNGTTDFDFLTFTESFESRIVGLNLRGGFSTKMGDQFRVGFSIETPTWYTVSEDFDTTLLTSFDNGDSYEYGDAIDEDAGRGSYDYTIRTPWRLGVGAAYDTGKFAVSADLEMVDWSQMELGSDVFSYADQNLTIQQELGTTVSLRTGAELRLDRLQFRAGLSVDPDARKNATGVSRDRGTVSLGMSYAANSQFTFDLGLMTEVFEDEYRPYTEVTDAPLVNEEVARGFLSLGIRVGL